MGLYYHVSLIVYPVSLIFNALLTHTLAPGLASLVFCAPTKNDIISVSSESEVGIRQKPDVKSANTPGTSVCIIYSSYNVNQYC